MDQPLGLATLYRYINSKKSFLCSNIYLFRYKWCIIVSISGPWGLKNNSYTISQIQPPIHNLLMISSPWEYFVFHSKTFFLRNKKADGTQLKLRKLEKKYISATKKTQIIESLLQPKHEFLAFFVCRDPLEKLLSVYKYLLDMRVGSGWTYISTKVIVFRKRKAQECLQGQEGKTLPCQDLPPGHSSYTW